MFQVADRTENGLRQVVGECGTFQIQERPDYSLTLTRRHEGETQEIGLYGVLVSGSFKSERVYVLAESEDGAVGQARCALKLERYHVDEDVEQQIRLHVERLPLVIRGWSGNRF